MKRSILLIALGIVLACSSVAQADSGPIKLSAQYKILPNKDANLEYPAVLRLKLYIENKGSETVNFNNIWTNINDIGIFNTVPYYAYGNSNRFVAPYTHDSDYILYPGTKRVIQELYIPLSNHEIDVAGEIEEHNIQYAGYLEFEKEYYLSVNVTIINDDGTTTPTQIADTFNIPTERHASRIKLTLDEYGNWKSSY